MAASFTKLFWMAGTYFTSFMATPETKMAHQAFHYLQDFGKFYSYMQDFPFWLKGAWLSAAICLFLAYYDIKIGRLSVRPNPAFTPAAVRPLRVFLRQSLMGAILLFSAFMFGYEACLAQIILLFFRDRYFFAGGFFLLLSVVCYTLIPIHDSLN